MNRCILCLPFLILLTSCGVVEPVKDTTTHHFLDPAVPERAVTGSKPTIAIARPSLPGYLDRGQLVHRSGNGQLEMNHDHLWAEPLDSAISRVTAQNLGRLCNSLNIQPVESFITLDYQSLVEIRISRFEADSSGSMILDCMWKIQPVSGKTSDTHPFRTSVPVPAGPTANRAEIMNARVSAMNEALARLAKAISAAI